MKTKTHRRLNVTARAVLVALVGTAGSAWAEEPKAASLEGRVRELEARMAKVEGRVAEHDRHNAAHAAHANHGGQTDQPMGQPPAVPMPSGQMPPQQGTQPGGGMGGGMSDM